jgi:hypothetical protein
MDTSHDRPMRKPQDRSKQKIDLKKAIAVMALITGVISGF